MNLRRATTVTLRAGVFSAWSLALSVVGLWLLLSTPAEMRGLVPVSTSAGLAALAGGQVLFMTMVADRYFPKAHPRVVAALEIVAAGLFLAGAIAFAWLFLSGGVA